MEWSFYRRITIRLGQEIGNDAHRPVLMDISAYDESMTMKLT